MADGYISAITLPNNQTFDLTDKNLKVYSGSCTSDGSTAIKQVTAPDNFELSRGTVIFVTFSQTNSVTAAKLKVNNTDEKTIRYLRNAQDPTALVANNIRANQTYMFSYDDVNDYWIVDIPYDANSNTYDRTNLNNNKKARAAIRAGAVCVGNSSGYAEIGTNVTFDITYPILYASAAISSGSQAANLYLYMPSVTSTLNTSGLTHQANGVLYIKGTLSGKTFTCDSGTLTYTIPTSEDNKIYIPVGINTNATSQSFYFLGGIPQLYEYKNGAFQSYTASHTHNYISPNSELLTTNPFAPNSLKGPYISKIDNAFYAMNKRYSVSTTGGSFSNGDVTKLFNGSYEDAAWLAADTSITIIVDFDPEITDITQKSGHFPGYPYGYFLISFYDVNGPASISARAYSNYNSTLGWHNLTFSPISDNTNNKIVYKSSHLGGYNITYMEFTITAPASTITKIAQIELHLDRPNSLYTPFLSKYGDETLYYNLTAPKFIGALQGNADTSTKWAADRTVYVALGTASKTVKINGSASDTSAIALGIDGTLKIANGGTGLSKAAPHAILIGPKTGSTSDTVTWRSIAPDDLPNASDNTAGIVLLGAANGAAAYSHTHGNISNDGAIGTNSGYAISTTTNGKLIAKSLSVSDPSASGTASSFISTISQNSDGSITATKANLPVASTTITGIVQITSANANAFINTLPIGDSSNTANDYIITQYVNGGSKTATYYRRTAEKVVNSALVKRALSATAASNAHGSNFLRKDGSWQPIVTDIASLTGSIGASDLVEALGLESAMHFIGFTDTAIGSGSATTTLTPLPDNNTSLTKTSNFDAGDVVIHNTSSGDEEYIWTGASWELLGRNTSFLTSHANGYGRILLDADTGTSGITANSTTLVSTTYTESLTFKTGNKWITAKGTNGTANGDTLTVGHALKTISTGTSTTSVGFGGTFVVPSVTADEAGHLSSVTLCTITLPSVTAATSTVIIKGTYDGSSNTLPTSHEVGWAYRVTTACTVGDYDCHAGDLVVCTTERTTANTSDWMVLQGVNNAMVTSVTQTVGSNNIPIFSGTNGYILKDSGVSISTGDISSNSTTTTIPTSKTVWDAINEYSGKLDTISITGVSPIVVTATSTTASVTASIGFGKVAPFTVLAGPSTNTNGNDTPVFRSLVTGDLPAHLHGNITSTGTIPATTATNKIAPATGTYIVITNTSGKIGLLETSFTSATSTFLSRAGTWLSVPDSKVNVIQASTSKGYILGTTAAPSASAVAVEAMSDTGVYLTTLPGEISAASHSINYEGAEKVHLVWNNTDSSLDFIFN